MPDSAQAVHCTILHIFLNTWRLFRHAVFPMQFSVIFGPCHHENSSLREVCKFEFCLRLLATVGACHAPPVDCNVVPGISRHSVRMPVHSWSCVLMNRPTGDVVVRRRLTPSQVPLYAQSRVNKRSCREKETCQGQQQQQLQQQQHPVVIPDCVPQRSCNIQKSALLYCKAPVFRVLQNVIVGTGPSSRSMTPISFRSYTAKARPFSPRCTIR